MEESRCIKRSATEKILFSLFCVVLVLCVILTGFVIFYTTRSENKSDICLTQACVKAAAKVLGAVDFAVDPCDNFYDFACGQWMRTNIIPEDKGYHATFTELRDEIGIKMKEILETDSTVDKIEAITKAKNLYKSCMNVDLIEERNISVLFPVMAELGGWPILEESNGGHWSQKEYNLDKLLGKLMKYFNYPLISIYTYTDQKGSDKVIYMDQSSLLLPSRQYYLNGTDNDVIKILSSIIKRFASMLGGNATIIERDVAEVINLEIEIAKILTPPEKRRDDEKKYNLFRLDELNKHFGTSHKHNFSLEGFAREVFSMEGVNIVLKNDERVIIKDVNFTTNLIKLLEKFSPRTLANYMILQFLKNRLHNLPKRFGNLVLELEKKIQGTSSEIPRWRKCVDFTTGSLDLAVGRLFVKDYFAPEAKVGMGHMINYINESFTEILHEIDWMDMETVTMATQKINAMEERIGYDEDILNNEKLNRRYENITVNTDQYFENVLGLLHTSVKANLQQIRYDVFKFDWETAPPTVNAYYSFRENKIMFPAGILQQPYFHKDQPWYLSFGAIGTLIGHEITHGFDDRGRRYDKNGQLNQWWNDEAIERFKSRTECFINQYNNFSVPEAGGRKMNGLLTLGENIADNGGIKQSYRGYKKWQNNNGGPESMLPGVSLTNEQLFFVAFSQIRCSISRKEEAIQSILGSAHSPSRFRPETARSPSKSNGNPPKSMNPKHTTGMNLGAPEG